ncbi:MAG: glycosyltransferase [Paraprevotella sp.]|nr:glycosyltransferase [Paraprevotella sp.]
MFSIQSYYRNDIQILRDLGYAVRLSKSCWDFMAFWRYSIAFIYFYRYGFFAALWAKLFGNKVYFTGGIDYLEPSFATPVQRRIQALFFRLCNRLSDRSFIVSSMDSYNVSCLYGGKLPPNCTLCYHVVDFSRFLYTGSISKKRGQYLLVAWMQNIDNVFRKGIDKAMMVFKEIHERHPQSRFILAGSPGEGSKYMEELIHRLGLDDGSAVYLGAISEELKVQLMLESQFYFMLSAYEGFGIAAIEALTAGCCLIHSGRGGLKDAAGPMGVRVNIDDLDSVIKTCLDLYEHPLSREEMEEGIRFVKERFCYETRLNTMKTYISGSVAPCH